MKGSFRFFFLYFPLSSQVGQLRHVLPAVVVRPSLTEARSRLQGGAAKPRYRLPTSRNLPTTKHRCCIPRESSLEGLRNSPLHVSLLLRRLL